MSVSGEMRAAAEVLEKVSALYDHPHPELGAWTAKGLRHEADVLEEQQ